MRLDLPAELRAEILAAARAAHPNECCGLLEGVRENDVVRVIALHPARNLSGDARRFEIDPGDHIAAQKAARANGSAIIGCYHSHPQGRAEPSAADLAGADEDNFLWLIAAGDDLAAFVYRDGRFAAVGADWVTSSG